MVDRKKVRNIVRLFGNCRATQANPRSQCGDKPICGLICQLTPIFPHFSPPTMRPICQSRRMARTQYRWREPALREFAWRKIRQEIAAELNLPTLEEFMQQKA